MPLTIPELQANLQRLRANLSCACGCTQTPDHETSSRQAATDMPLCHTTSEKTLGFILTSGALLSPVQRGATPRRADVLLGATNDVCFYLGSAAFPDNDFGFLFSQVLTSDPGDHASATPFDSGGCIRRYTLPPGVDGPSHVQSHSMPVPACRDYLGDLLVSHFENPRAYLAGDGFTCPSCKKSLADPHGMNSPDAHALFRMHEVRIPGRVELQTPLLLAVFAPRGIVPPSLAPLISSGVKLVLYDNTADKDRTRALRTASLEYILNQVLN